MREASDPCGELLKSVSRSFYLTIALLPAALRRPVGLAYLLARATDTVADTVTADRSTRLRHLDRMKALLREEKSNMENDLQALQRDIIPTDPSEHRLLERLGECVRLIRAEPNPNRSLIELVIEKIIRGQRTDLERFAGPANPAALETPEELYGYTYLVAGCVGEFWTRICAQHLPEYSTMPLDRLLQLGVNFGKGLQLVNILRDAPTDLRQGRCYLPLNQLRDVGISSPEILLEKPELARPVVDRWRRIAVRHLDDAAQYIMAIRPLRIRIACFLPWYLGLRTLSLLAKEPSLESTSRVKVGRGEVRAALLLSPVAAGSNAALQKISDRLQTAAKTPS